MVYKIIFILVISSISITTQQPFKLGRIDFDDPDKIDPDLLEKIKELFPEGVNEEKLKEIEAGITQQIEKELEKLRDSDTVSFLGEENKIESMKKRLWFIRKAKDRIPKKYPRKINATCEEGRILYPFGQECGDLEISKDMTRSFPIKLGYTLKIMGHHFDTAWINQHGFISFQESFLGIVCEINIIIKYN